MKGKDFAILLRAGCFIVWFQITFCRLHLELSTQFCCEKRSQSSNFSCWNNTSEENSVQNTSTFDNKCTQNVGDKLCFNVTAIRSCRNDSIGNVVGTEKNEIHIGAFVPFLEKDKYGYYSAMKMAIDIINNRSDILNNYTLVLDTEDTLWARGANAIKAFFNLLSKKHKPVMLLGPSTTSSLEPIAEAAPKWRLVQVSYASGSPKFESKLTYPYTYRASPSSTSYSKAKADFISYYGWSRVAILHQYDPEFFSPTVAKLKIELEKNNISIIAVEGFEERGDVSFQMQKLKTLDARIIIGEFSFIGARKVFCEAFKNKMYGSHYAWIIFGDFSPEEIFVEDSKLKDFIDCTSKDLKQAAHRYISTIKLDLRQDNNKTISGMTSKEFWDQMQQLNERNSLTKETAYAFDSAWVVAMALNFSLANGLTYEKLLNRGGREVFKIKNGIEKVNFPGVTGPVRFDKNRERRGTILLKQNRGGNETRIGQHFAFSGQLLIFESQRDKIWEDNHPPKDRTVRILEFMMSPISLIVIMWFMAMLGITCSLSFLYFNISNGNNRIIKMSSPKLNNIIILGCILCYASVILLGLDARFLDFKRFGINCNARTAVLSIGFSLSFGAIFSKTWRVHKIVTASTANKKMATRDLHLLAMVAGLLSVDAILLASWFAIDPLQAKELSFEEKSMKSPDEQDTIIIPALYQCTCRYKSYFLTAVFAYKGILLLFGLFLAWETRNVTIPALNDSKYIGMSVYNVFVLAIIGAIVAIALDGSMYYEASYTISSLCLIVGTTVTLLLVFVPKFHQFRLKDVASTETQALRKLGGNVNRPPAGGQIITCARPAPKKSRTLFACKATQTDCDDPSSEDEAVFKNQGFAADEFPEKKQLEDTHLNEIVVAELNTLASEIVDHK